MNRTSKRSSRGQAGMTLVELLVTIVILGVISFALTQSIILGFRTTEGTGDRVSNSNATQAISKAITGDGQSAQQIFSTDSPDPAQRCFDDTGVVELIELLHLRWTDRQVVAAATPTPEAPTEVRPIEQSVSYTLVRQSTEGKFYDVVRWSCDRVTSSRTSKVIATMTVDRASEIEILCDDVENPSLVPNVACPTFTFFSSAPASPRLLISTEQGEADDVVVHRRSL